MFGRHPNQKQFVSFYKCDTSIYLPTKQEISRWKVREDLYGLTESTDTRSISNSFQMWKAHNTHQSRYMNKLHRQTTFLSETHTSIIVTKHKPDK